MRRLIVLLMLLASVLVGFLYVYLGFGASKVSVPPIVGKELTAATKLLNGMGLGIKVVGEEESTTFPPNYIVSQKPLPGVSIRKGSSIEVVISGKGDMVSVPEFIGRKLDEVSAFIRDAGLVIGDVINIRSLLAGENVVIGQSIPPSKRVKRGSKVDLLVSTGYEIKETSVPDLIGMTLEEAKRIIQERGFKLGKVLEKIESGEAGVVISQNPPPLSPISIGGEISLTIRKQSLVEVREEKPKETLQEKATDQLSVSATQRKPESIKTEAEKLELAVPKGARIIDFTFKVPTGKEERLVEIIQIDANGQHVVFKKKCKAGDVISLRIPAFGDNVIRVQLDGEFYAEDRYPWKKE